MRPVEEALRLLLAGLRDPGEERVPLAAAWGRRLSREVRRRLPQPPFTRSRVDGYAVGLADLGASTLAIAGEVMAGGEPPPPLAPGTALRVMTGAPLPEGVGAVVPFEEVPEGNGARTGDRIALTRKLRRGQNVIRAGKDGAAGAEILPAGAWCGPVELGLLAEAGETVLWVRRRPRVALVATGSELILPGEPLTPGKIYASNLHLLAGLVAAWGGEPEPVPPLPDRLARLCETLTGAAAGADLVLVTGGVAGGDRDFSRRAVAELGWTVLLDGADFHPGGRCAVAQAPGGTEVCFLSGGPGACLTAAALIAVPLLAALAGRPWTTVTATLAESREEPPAAVPSGRGRRRAVPVALRLDGGRLWAVPQPHSSGSPVVSRGTEGVFLLPPGGGGEGREPGASAENAAGTLAGPRAGEPVEVWPLVPTLPEGGLPGKK
ncbi:MAG TPA: molybdopterin molybdotransferase MoeA [Firmicutes bacterium]|nr:molybdopterin molybdotransferase MoeA [Bacillota bacterium]